MNFQPADIVFFNPVPVLSELLKFALRCPWSHSSLATGNGVEVIGAEAEGIIKRPLTDKELKDYAVLRYPKSMGHKWVFQRNRIMEWAIDQEKVEYDFLQLFVGYPFLVDVHNDAKLTCSVYVYLAYKQVGIELVRRITLFLIDPSHIWSQATLVEVECQPQVASISS